MTATLDPAPSPVLTLASRVGCFRASFFARGEPKGQPRPRAFSRGGHARVFDPGTAEGWKGAVVYAGQPHRPAVPLDGPLIVSLQFHLPRPKSLMRRKDPDGPMAHVGRPDRDNLDKAVLDAMTADGWWRDDSQVCGGSVEKLYHAKDGVPGCYVLVQEIAR